MGTKRVGWARIRSLINENQNALHPPLRMDAGDAGSQGPTKIIIGKNGDATGTTASPYEESSSQLYDFGTLLRDGNRVYRYAGVGGTGLACGVCVQHRALHNANHRDMAVQAAAGVGATSVAVTFGGDTDAAANLYAGGYLMINDAAGQGQMMKIRSHAAVDASDSTTCTLNLYDKVTTALTTSSKADLITAVYDDLIIAPAAETGAVIGVTVRAMTADYYGWVQVGGPCSILQAGTVILGHNVVRSAGTAGAVAPATSDLLDVLGTAIVVNGSGDHAAVWLHGLM